ncbi:hypothetical protein MHBO_003314, partial [Bonamia ostreae]
MSSTSETRHVLKELGIERSVRDKIRKKGLTMDKLSKMSRNDFRSLVPSRKDRKRLDEWIDDYYKSSKREKTKKSKKTRHDKSSKKDKNSRHDKSSKKDKNSRHDKS